MQRLYVNDTPVILHPLEETINFADYELKIDASALHNLDDIKLKDDVLVVGASERYIKSCLDSFSKERVKKLDSITFLVDNLPAVKKFIKSQFKVIKAAGGVVEKEGKVLLIYRMGKWDLPKGKLEKHESPEKGALREVAEECNIKVGLREKICFTWHTYTRNGKKILKKTHWYRMECVDDVELCPQIEEDITEVRWMNQEEVMHVLYNSYNSIRQVMRTYYKDTL
jgi:8-oxo-(d)GTP phosphatase